MSMSDRITISERSRKLKWVAAPWERIGKFHGEAVSAEIRRNSENYFHVSFSSSQYEILCAFLICRAGAERGGPIETR